MAGVPYHCPWVLCAGRLRDHYLAKQTQPSTKQSKNRITSPVLIIEHCPSQAGSELFKISILKLVLILV